MSDGDDRIELAAVLDRVRATVQAVASADPNPSDPYRGLYVSDELAVRLGSDGPPLRLEERFDLVCERLALAPLDRAVLAVCAAPEVHPDFGRMFGYLHDDLTRPAPTPRLVARLLSGPGVSDADVLVCFDGAAPLCTSGALRFAAEGPLADRAVTVAPQVAAYLLGSNVADAIGRGSLRRRDPARLPLGRDDAIRRLAAVLAGPRELPLAVSGPDALDVLGAAAGRGLVILDARAAAEEDACADLALAAALEDRVAVVDGLSEIAPEGRERALGRLFALACRPVLSARGRDDTLVLADHAVLLVDVPGPNAAEREAAWIIATDGGDVGEVAAGFRLDVRRIGEAAAIARADAASRDVALDREVLAMGARTASSRRVAGLADLLTPGPGWDDLVLPARQLGALHSMASYLVHRELVLEDWGFERVAQGQGLTALFAGESGTGKTLAARVVAGVAGRDVYRVDLAGLFSKWVGETEKNLDRIFTAAEGSNAVLFFDEADVVFSKRSEVSSSSDRYANLETAYLLQRIEGYEGIVVLATNLRSNIDRAFVRRIDIAVDFPPPDAATRRRLWAALTPERAPVAADVDLDFLAERFELTGGAIRNCIVAAAFLAADDGGQISMAHLVRAVALEYAKQGRLTLEADFEQFHPLVRDPR